MQHAARFWCNYAQNYAPMPIANVPADQRKLALTKARLRPQDVIMDIGCGTGALALELSPWVAEVHAVDGSAEMLGIARAKAQARGVKNVFFHHEHAERLPSLPRASVDGICAYNIMHLVENRREMLARVMRLLKPGGFFIASTLCLGESAVPFGLLLPPLKWLGKAPAVEIFDFDTHLAELDTAGFAIIRMHQIEPDNTVAFVTAHKPR